MAAKDQTLQLNTQDFLSDIRLRECAAASVGVYIMTLCLLFRQEERGILSLTERDIKNATEESPDVVTLFTEKLRRHLPFDSNTIERALYELLDAGVLLIDGTRLISEEVVKNTQTSEKRSSAGRMGGRLKKDDETDGQTEIKQNESKTKAKNFENEKFCLEFACENDKQNTKQNTKQNESKTQSKMQAKNFENEKFCLEFACENENNTENPLENDLEIPTTEGIYNNININTQSLTTTQEKERDSKENIEIVGKEGVAGGEKGERGKGEEEERGSPCPYQKIRELFNTTCKSFPHIVGIEGSRKKAVAARWRQYPSLDKFSELFRAAEASDFLKGKNNRNWSATFDWLMNATNMSKVLEGNYSRGEPQRSAKAPSYDLNAVEAAARNGIF